MQRSFISRGYDKNAWENQENTTARLLLFVGMSVGWFLFEFR